MSKKILGICVALVALAAFVIPASASASAILRDTVGGVPTALAPGAKIKAISDEHSVFETGGVGVTCDHNWMTAEVHTNDATNGITGTITGAAFNGPEVNTLCNGGSLLGATKVKIPALEAGGHWCIKNKPGLDEFEVLPHGCTETGGEFTFTLEGNLTCSYVRSAGVSGTFTTTSDVNSKLPATLTAAKTEFTKDAGSGFLCPANGSITTMKFNLFTEDETTPVEIADL